MTALAELNRPPPFRRPSPPGSKRAAFASAPPPPADDDDDDWAALEAAAEADAAERAALMLNDEGDDVDMDVLREIEAQEREASSRRDGDTRGAGTTSLGKGAAGVQKTASTTSAAPTGDRKGKSRMLLEEDDEFGAVGEEGSAAESLLSRGASLSPISEPLRDRQLTSRPAQLPHLAPQASPAPRRTRTTTPRASAPSRPSTCRPSRRATSRRRPSRRRHSTASSSCSSGARSSRAGGRPGRPRCVPFRSCSASSDQLHEIHKLTVHAHPLARPQKQESVALEQLAASMLAEPYVDILRSIEQDAAIAKKQQQADACVLLPLPLEPFCPAFVSARRPPST